VPKTTHVHELGLSLAENDRIQTRSFSAGFQVENYPFKNSNTDGFQPFSRCLALKFVKIII